MTCPNCKCPTCKAAAVNAVLGKIVSRETVPVEVLNAQAVEAGKAKEAWRDTFGEAR